MILHQQSLEVSQLKRIMYKQTTTIDNNVHVH